MGDNEKGPVRNRRVRVSAPPRTKSAKDIKKASKIGILVETSWVDKIRPTKRGDCVDGPRPCPWVMCKYHLYLDVGDSGSVKFNFPDLGPLDMENTCALDIADQGGTTLDEIGNFMNLSRERIRQLEVKIIDKLRAKTKDL